MADDPKNSADDLRTSLEMARERAARRLKGERTTVRALVAEAGMADVVKATGRSEKSVRRWIAENQIPADQYLNVARVYLAPPTYCFSFQPPGGPLGFSFTPPDPRPDNEVG